MRREPWAGHICSNPLTGGIRSSLHEPSANAFARPHVLRASAAFRLGQEVSFFLHATKKIFILARLADFFIARYRAEASVGTVRAAKHRQPQARRRNPTPHAHGVPLPGAGMVQKLRQPGRARRDVADYLLTFYHQKRLNSALGNMSPAEFER